MDKGFFLKCNSAIDACEIKYVVTDSSLKHIKRKHGNDMSKSREQSRNESIYDSDVEVH